MGGLVVTALGMGIALIGGVLTSALLKHSTLYQEIRFSLFYLGFAMIVWGFVRMMRAGARTGATAVHPWVPNTLAVVFGASVGIALGFLLTPSTYAVNDFGDQTQLPIYFMPLMTASGGGAIIFLGLAARRLSRDRSTWVGLFALAVLIGVVQEARVVPAVGDSFLGILGIFIPFAVGAWLLPLAAVGPVK
ncbi:MAG: hypothetical protein M3003_04820 [Candidatus Dormibacteraeota bacterium]|nr:hypothetical protein [Candidatus Dormibacteraeota bacterium]